MESFKDLIAYQKSYKLALEVYKITRKFPKSEIYILTSQMRRSAVSIPSNIAEGYRRGSRKEYIQFLTIAFGSCGELETQISLSFDLGLISGEDEKQIFQLVVEVSKLLNGLIHSLR